MIDKKKWEEGIEAWKRIKEQSEIDIEQANLYIKAITKKIETLEETKNGK